MAFIGMRHVVMAELESHTPGSEPTYKAGTGRDVGLAINGNLTINRNSNPLYAEDSVAEDDNGITGMELELGTDDLDDETQEAMGLVKAITTGPGDTAVKTYYDSSAPSKKMGLGYVRVRRKHGVTSFQAVWGFSARFSLNSENSQTKGESIEWQTPVVNGKFEGLDTDGSGDFNYRKRQNFATEALAGAWLDSLAGIVRA